MSRILGRLYDSGKGDDRSRFTMRTNVIRMTATVTSNREFTKTRVKSIEGAVLGSWNMTSDSSMSRTVRVPWVTSIRPAMTQIPLTTLKTLADVIRRLWGWSTPSYRSTAIATRFKDCQHDRETDREKRTMPNTKGTDFTESWFATKKVRNKGTYTPLTRTPTKDRFHSSTSGTLRADFFFWRRRNTFRFPGRPTAICADKNTTATIKKSSGRRWAFSSGAAGT